MARDNCDCVCHDGEHAGSHEPTKCWCYETEWAPTTPRCDVCNIVDEKAAEWCGNCGCCKQHCQQHEGCKPKCICPMCQSGIGPCSDVLKMTGRVL